ncbi:MAG: glycosyltransferase family 4 protein [Bacteroidetes bacterium]|nr:glycosyltransferase family 4 protein [Bacteroidota bacterium]
MKILHVFDRYLNSTMNWAFQLLKHTEETEHIITAPLFIDNPFRKAPFTFLDSPYQQSLPQDEWSIPNQQQLFAHFGQRSGHYQRYLFNQIKRHKPDLIHTHFATMGWRAHLPALRTNTPLIISFYGYDYERLPYRKPIYKKRYQQLFKQASVLITEGEHGASILARQGCPPEKIKVVPLGVQPDTIPFIRRKPQSPFKLLQAATFTPKKGQIYSVQALEKALQNHPDLELTLLGEIVDQAYFDEIKSFVDSHGLIDKVHFQKFVDPADFHQFLGGFHLFIHPSCYADDKDCEGGAPIVLLDAQATGMPIISTRHCDIPAEVIHGKTGWLSAEKDVVDLAAGITHFRQLSELEYGLYAQQAREHVGRHFDVRQSGRTLNALYRQLLKA